jgi:hypothetical protein
METPTAIPILHKNHSASRHLLPSEALPTPRAMLDVGGKSFADDSWKGRKTAPPPHSQNVGIGAWLRLTDLRTSDAIIHASLISESLAMAVWFKMEWLLPRNACRPDAPRDMSQYLSNLTVKATQWTHQWRQKKHISRDALRTALLRDFTCVTTRRTEPTMSGIGFDCLFTIHRATFAR